MPRNDIEYLDRSVHMAKVINSVELLNWVNQNNWLLLWASEGNIVSVFLTPSGNIMEFYFEKNKVTLKTLPSYVCK